MNARSSLRRLLRAASRHDRLPALKALLPLASPSVEQSLDSPGAVPLRVLVSHAVRTLQPVGAPAEAHRLGAAALRDAASMLEANLRRESAYMRKKREEEQRSLRGVAPPAASANLAWFHSRMETAARRNVGGEEAAAARSARQRQRTRALLAQVRAAAGLPPLQRATSPPAAAAGEEPLQEEPLAVLHQMVAARVVPPRRLVQLALTSLAASGVPGDFERALGVFWFMETATSYRLCSSCLDSLVMGAMEAQPPPPAGAPPHVWRALSIAEAILMTARMVPSSHVTNRLLEAAAASADDAAGVARARAAISRFSSAGVPILEDVSVALLGAAERVGDLAAATAACRQIRSRGGILKAELLEALWHWAKSLRDEDSATWLHAELVAAQQAAAKAAAVATPPPAVPQTAEQTPTQKE
jgi:hypothetical protein